MHGANRLGTNSLVDLVVYGRRAGQHIARFVKQADLAQIGKDPQGPSRSLIESLTEAKKGPHGGRIREEMKDLMMDKVGIYRKEQDMREAVKRILSLRDRYREVRVQDKSERYNTDLKNLLDLSLLTASSAEPTECAVPTP